MTLNAKRILKSFCRAFIGGPYTGFYSDASYTNDPIYFYDGSIVNHNGNSYLPISIKTSSSLSIVNILNSAMVSSGSSGSVLSFKVGSSSTAPTVNDYDLNERITSGLSGTATYNKINGVNPSIDILLGITNTSNVNKEIREIGLYAGNITSSTKLILIDHSLVEPEIILEPSESCSIDYRLTLILPEITE